MLFLVDGYNVTMADPATRGLDKERQRDDLVRRLSTRSRLLLGTGDVVVVFDARGQLGLATEKVGGVLVVFAPDADTEIVRRASMARGQVTVVSNDRRLTARISQDVGRQVVYREASVAFHAAAPDRTTGRRIDSGAHDEPAPRGAADITRELEAIWLDDDEEEGNC